MTGVSLEDSAMASQPKETTGLLPGQGQAVQRRKRRFCLPFPLLSAVVTLAIVAGLYVGMSVLPPVPPAVSDSPTLPHIIVIKMDDLGWGGVGYQSSNPELSTPNIDRLAAAGVKMGRSYSHYQSTPARCGYFSGRMPVHVDLDSTHPAILNPDDPVSGFAGIPRNMTCFAEKLKKAGYCSHLIGKWDVGMATPDHMPTGRGFDTSVHFFAHNNDYWTMEDLSFSQVFCQRPIFDCWKTDSPCNSDELFGLPVADIDPDDEAALFNCGGETSEHLETFFLDSVEELLKEHDPATPLFLDYNMHLVSDPFEIPREVFEAHSFIPNDGTEDYHRRISVAMSTMMDDIVGSIEKMFTEKGMWDDTLLVFTSTNGGVSFATTDPYAFSNNYPLKGGKMSPFEGGIRVPTFVGGPYFAKVANPERIGAELDGMIHMTDWYAVFAAITGQDLEDPKAEAAGLPPIESLNIWPYLIGETDESPRTEVHVDDSTLIVGEWKLLLGEHIGACNGGPVYPNETDPTCDVVMDCGDAGCLFNVVTDIGEHHDVAASEPEIVQSMLEQLGIENTMIFDPDRGDVDHAACDQAFKNGNIWGPWVE